jgi:predicted lipase
MFFTFFRACITNFSTQLAELINKRHGVFICSGQKTGSHATHVGTVAIKFNAFGHHGYVFFV